MARVRGPWFCLPAGFLLFVWHPPEWGQNVQNGLFILVSGAFRVLPCGLSLHRVTESSHSVAPGSTNPRSTHPLVPPNRPCPSSLLQGRCCLGAVLYHMTLPPRPSPPQVIGPGPSRGWPMTFEVPWLAQNFEECQLDQSDSPLGPLAPKNQYRHSV